MRIDADDTELEQTEALAAAVRRSPQDFPAPASLARHAGVSGPVVSERLRRHFHSAPDDFLEEARCAAAKRLLVEADGADPAELARRVGFASPDAFAAQFVRRNGLSPAAYARLGRQTHFELTLPEAYPLEDLKRALGRDPVSVSERLDGDAYRAAIRTARGTGLLTLRFAGSRVAVEASAVPAAEAHALVVGILGLEQNADGFARVARRARLGRLVSGREGLRIVQTPSVFEGLLWAIIGQQINLPFAFALRRRLFELAGERVRGTDFRAPPRPAEVARLEPGDLLPLQFSRQKADYLIGVSRRIVSGELDLDGLRAMSATRIQRALLSQRGLGPWSVNYVMMRSLGLADCVPVGDTGLTSGLQSLLGLKERPDAPTTHRLMEVFAPYRSLATAHLWVFNRLPDTPARTPAA